jgi:hypothetical protein
LIEIVGDTGAWNQQQLDFADPIPSDFATIRLCKQLQRGFGGSSDAPRNQSNEFCRQLRRIMWNTIIVADRQDGARLGRDQKHTSSGLPLP